MFLNGWLEACLQRICYCVPSLPSYLPCSMETFKGSWGCAITRVWAWRPGSGLEFGSATQQARCFPQNLSLLIYNMEGLFLPRNLWISKENGYESLYKGNLILTFLHHGHGRNPKQEPLITALQNLKQILPWLAFTHTKSGHPHLSPGHCILSLWEMSWVLDHTPWPLWFFLKIGCLDNAWDSFRASDEH